MRRTILKKHPQLRRIMPAFTLVELLVVIGIIAVLISILLPALSSAREIANNVKCRSNLNQVGVALRMYANDNRDHFPSPEAVGDAPTIPVAAGFRRGVSERDSSNPSLTETLGLPNLLAGTFRGEKGIAYLKNPEVWVCPSWSGRQATKVERNSYETRVSLRVSNFTSLQRGKTPKAAALLSNGSPNPNAGNTDYDNWWYVRDNVSLGPQPTNQALTSNTTLLWNSLWYYPHKYRINKKVQVNVSMSTGSQNVLYYDGAVGSLVVANPGGVQTKTWVRGEP